MARDKDATWARTVSLRSREAGDSRVEGTIDERLTLVSVLSLSAWENSGRPFPSYARSEMPIRVVRLGARPDRD